MSRIEFNILLVGSGHNSSLENMYLRAFAKSDFCKVELFDVDMCKPSLTKSRYLNRITNQLRIYNINKSLHNHLKRHSNAYDIIIIFKGMPFKQKSIASFKEISKKSLWVNINPDDPYNIANRGASNTNVLKSINQYDVYCIWSQSIAKKLSADCAKNVVYLPFGYDEECHRPPQIRLPINYSMISFVGGWDKYRERILEHAASFDLMVFGNGWERVSGKTQLSHKIYPGHLFGEGLSKTIYTSGVSLNILRLQNTGSHNMRTFEIPSMGGLMLTNRTEEQQEFFPENEACYMYGDMEELQAKITHILNHPQEAERVRKRGMELVQVHSYTNRVRQLMNDLQVFL